MNFRRIGELHWLAKAGIAVLALFLVLAVCSMFSVNLFSLFTPLVVFFLIMIIILVLLVDFGRRWLQVQEKLAAGKTADTNGIEREIQSLRQSVESMETKLDNIERILEKVSE